MLCVKVVQCGKCMYEPGSIMLIQAHNTHVTAALLYPLHITHLNTRSVHIHVGLRVGTAATPETVGLWVHYVRYLSISCSLFPVRCFLSLSHPLLARQNSKEMIRLQSAWQQIPLLEESLSEGFPLSDKLPFVALEKGSM